MTIYILAPSTLHYLFKLLLQFIFILSPTFLLLLRREFFLFFRRFFFPWLFCGKSCVFLSLVSPIIQFPYFSSFYLANLSVNWRFNILKKGMQNHTDELCWPEPKKEHTGSFSPKSKTDGSCGSNSQGPTPSTHLCVINSMHKGCVTVMTGHIEWCAWIHVGLHQIASMHTCTSKKKNSSRKHIAPQRGYFSWHCLTNGCNSLDLGEMLIRRQQIDLF